MSAPDRALLILAVLMIGGGLIGATQIRAMQKELPLHTQECPLPLPEKRTQSEFVCQPRADLAKAMGVKEHMDIYLCGRFKR